MLNPTELENKLAFYEEQLTEKVIHLSQRFYILLLFFSLFSFACYFIFARSEFPEWMRFQLFSARYIGALILAVGGLLLPLIPRNNLTIFYFALASAVWISSVWFASMDSVSIIAAIPPLSLLILFALKRSLQWTGKYIKFQNLFLCAFTVFIFVGMITLISWSSIQQSDFTVFKMFWLLHLEMLMLFFIRRSLNPPLDDSLISLNPLQLWFPMPWSPATQWQTNQKTRDRLYYSGWLQIGLCLIGVALLQLTHWILERAFQWTEWPGFFIHFGQYAYFLIFISCGFGVASGFMKIFGFEKAEIVNFLLFSKSPLEVWQRGNRPMANFLFEIIYLPLFRRTRSISISLFAIAFMVFLNLYLLPDVILRKILKWATPDIAISDVDFQKSILSPLVWILLWIAWILFFEKALQMVRRHLSLAQKPLFLWTLVLLTHIGSSQILPLARILIKEIQ